MRIGYYPHGADSRALLFLAGGQRKCPGPVPALHYSVGFQNIQRPLNSLTRHAKAPCQLAIPGNALTPQSALFNFIFNPATGLIKFGCPGKTITII